MESPFENVGLQQHVFKREGEGLTCLQLAQQVEVAADQQLQVQLHPVVVVVLGQQQEQQVVEVAATRPTVASPKHLHAAMGFLSCDIL